MVLLQIDSTSDVVFSTLNAGIGNLVWFWEASQAQKGRPRALKPITHNIGFWLNFALVALTYSWICDRQLHMNLAILLSLYLRFLDSSRKLRKAETA